MGIFTCFQTIGENLYTISDVVEEIRDKATKQRLQVLPYTLTFREPSAEAIHAGGYLFICTVIEYLIYFQMFFSFYRV